MWKLRIRNLCVEQTWIEGDEEFTRTVYIESPDDIRKIMDMLGDVGDEITYFVTNPSTPSYCIFELGKDRRVIKETRVFGNSFVLEQGKNEWRELLNSTLTKVLDAFLGPVDVVREKIVDRTLRALDGQSI